MNKIKKIIAVMLVMTTIMTSLPFVILNANADDEINLTTNIVGIHNETNNETTYYNRKEVNAYVDFYRMDVNLEQNNSYTQIVNDLRTNIFFEVENEEEKVSFMSKVNSVKGAIGQVGNLAVSLYTCINEWDTEEKWYVNVGKIAMNMALSYFGISLPGGPSEADQIIDAVSKMMEEVNAKLDNISEKIDDVHDSVNENSVNLAKLIVSMSKADRLNERLNDFTGLDFNYNALKDNINVKYESLMDAIKKGLDEQTINGKYDALYETLTENLTGAQYSPLQMLRNYAVGDYESLTNLEKASIQRSFYDYLVIQEQTTEKSGVDDIETACVQFALDLYSTYLFAEYCLNLCNINLMDRLNNSKSDSLQIGDETITKHDIGLSMSSSYTEQKKITIQMAKDLAYFCNLESSYIYENGAMENTPLYTVQYREKFDEQVHRGVPCVDVYGVVFEDTYYIRTNNLVSVGDTLYMNVMPDIFNDMFAEGEFTFHSSNESVATVNKAGVVNIKGGLAGDQFTITMAYNGEAVYSLSFEIAERKYSGGMGAASCPYILSTIQDIKDFVATPPEKQIHFKLANDINMISDNNEPTDIPCIEYFYGTLDGDGHKIYNFSIYRRHYITGFIRTNFGTVKNLTIGDPDADNQDFTVFSTKICSEEYTHGSRDQEYFVGGIAAINEKDAVIDNCKVTNVLVQANITPTEYTMVGGIVGQNKGTVKNCEVNNSYINISSGFSSKVSVGGCAGQSGTSSVEGTLDNCVSHNNQIFSKHLPYDGKGQSCAGGMAGYIGKKGMIKQCVTYQNEVDGMFDPTSGWFDSYNFEGYFAGKNDGSDCTGCTCYTTKGSAIAGGNTKGITVVAEEKPIDISKIEKDPTTGVIVPQYENVTEYKTGEKFFKQLDEDGDVIICSLSEYRIDTSVPSSVQPDQYVTHLYYDDDGILRKEKISITIQQAAIERIAIYSRPNKTSYAIGSSIGNDTGLSVAVIYDNGSGEVVTEGYSLEYDFSTAGKKTVAVAYKGFTTSFDAYVICEEHVNFKYEFASSPLQHKSTCSVCEQTELEDHVWDGGAITLEPTYSASGNKTFTCTYCNAVYVEKIPALPLDENAPMVVVDTIKAIPGSTVTVNVNLKNNPGITSMILKATYDTSLLTLTNVTYNSEMGGQTIYPTTMSSPVTLYWVNGFTNTVYDGAFATLTFKVADNALPDQYSDITVSYNADDVYNIADDNVTFVTQTGKITVIDYVPGDINGDGVLNNKDVTRLMQYYADWDVTVNDLALDVNGDGEKNNKDVTRLMQYLADWDVEIH